jgi:hypothetical protein
VVGVLGLVQVLVAVGVGQQGGESGTDSVAPGRWGTCRQPCR